MPIDPIFEYILRNIAPPTEKELTAIRSMTEPWQNPELEVVALKISRLDTTPQARRDRWDIIDLLKEIDGRAAVTPKGAPCSPTNA